MHIRLYPAPILRQKCHTVTDFNFELHAILDEMHPMMLSNNGMGLAANQVGYTNRMFIMIDSKGQLFEFINPVIVHREGTQFLEEGCLSAPGMMLKLKRSATIQVQAQNRYGEEFQIIAEGIEAVCIQHEMDHLDGIFFLEKE